MTRLMKIALVGLSGAGKTTTLKNLCKNVFLSGEMERLPTPDEAKAWDLPEDENISTTLFCNIGTVIVRCVNNSIIYRDKFGNSINDYVITIHDTVGFKNIKEKKDKIGIGDELYRFDALESSDGLLFVIDSAVDLYSEEYSPRIIQVFQKLLGFYARIYQQFPIPVFIANKQDLIHKRSLQEESAGKSAKFRATLRALDPIFSYVPIVDASALDNWGIREAFEFLVMAIVELRMKEARSKEKRIGMISDNLRMKEFLMKLERTIKIQADYQRNRIEALGNEGEIRDGELF